MIITLFFVIMILLGLIIKKCDIGEDPDMAGGTIIWFGCAFLLLSLVIIIAAHALADKDIQRNKMQYEGLCKRYEIITSEYEDMSKSDVIRDITVWNMKVYNTKYWTENPWTNWFNPRQIADNLEYIPLEKESEVEE